MPYKRWPDATYCSSRRAALRGLAGVALAGWADGWAQSVTARTPLAASAPRLRLLSHISLPHGTSFQNRLIGGLSGLAYDADEQLWYALSDDRSRYAPARCYVLRLPASGADQPPEPAWVDVITLLGPDGQPFPPYAVDPEALALRRDPVSGRKTLLWSSEGDVRAGLPPAVFESALDGRLLRRFTLPAQLTELGRSGQGPRNNATLEGLALTPDGGHVWAAMEAALLQDQPPPRPVAPPGPCRFTRLDCRSGLADRQVAYQPEPLPFGPGIPLGPAESGVAEILLRDADRMWVLERAYALGRGVSARLYEAQLNGATDTLALGTLRPGRYRPCAKRLLLELRDSGLPHVDNFEAMSWGPPLPHGARSLVLMTDDNFNPLQVTQIALFEVTGLC